MTTAASAGRFRLEDIPALDVRQGRIDFAWFNLLRFT